MRYFCMKRRWNILSSLFNRKRNTDEFDGTAEIAIQFILHEDDSLEIWTMELNGQPLSKLEQVGFLEAMYGN